jgi:hypothetical protein
MTQLRVALFQTDPIWQSPEKNMQQLAQQMQQTTTDEPVAYEQEAITAAPEAVAPIADFSAPVQQVQVASFGAPQADSQQWGASAAGDNWQGY